MRIVIIQEGGEIIKYIWINPVAEKMYGTRIELLKSKLIKRSYKIADCESQLEFVKNEYIEYSKIATKTILDCRCPEAINILKRNNLISDFSVPMIEPILVRTARILHSKFIKNSDDSLIITCPCTQLREFAKKRLKNLPNITFYTWKEFCINEKIELAEKIAQSPIPLGYFKDSFTKVCELSEENEIIKEIKEIKKKHTNTYEIIELLYCRNGCNNGDGL